MRHRARPDRLAVMVTALALAALTRACGTGGPDPQASFGGATLTIVARGLAFSPDIATAPASTPLRIVLDNQDAGVADDIRVFQGDTEIARSAAVVGPAMVAVVLPPLAPGRYQFASTTQPDMIGTLLVAEGAPVGPSIPDSPPPADPSTPAAASPPGEPSPVPAASGVPAASPPGEPSPAVSGAPTAS